MLKEFEKRMIERYKKYSKKYDEYNKGPSSCEAGHLQEISWILHELFGYTDKEIRELEDDIKAEIMREDIISNFVK